MLDGAGLSVKKHHLIAFFKQFVDFSLHLGTHLPNIPFRNDLPA
ncbi:hypothetical protein Shewmr4_0184 [Shewanella sp. MR-4]|nr:hypothetical protein Shewmr4_0184 [Shewanella sp. MR-4]